MRLKLFFATIQIFFGYLNEMIEDYSDGIYGKEQMKQSGLAWTQEKKCI